MDYWFGGGGGVNEIVWIIGLGGGLNYALRL